MLIFPLFRATNHLADKQCIRSPTRSHSPSVDLLHMLYPLWTFIISCQCVASPCMLIWVWVPSDAAPPSPGAHGFPNGERICGYAWRCMYISQSTSFSGNRVWMFGFTLAALVKCERYETDNNTLDEHINALMWVDEWNVLADDGGDTRIRQHQHGDRIWVEMAATRLWPKWCGENPNTRETCIMHT